MGMQTEDTQVANTRVQKQEMTTLTCEDQTKFHLSNTKPVGNFTRLYRGALANS
jgi:hypothetical protein